MTKTDVDYSAKAISLKQLKSDWEGGSSSEFYTSLSRLGDIDGTPQVGGTAWVEYKMTPTSSGNNIIIHYTAGSGGSGSGGTGTGSGGTTPTTPALPSQAEGGLQDSGGNNTSWEDLLSDGILVEDPKYHGKQELKGVATGKTIAGTLVIKEAITNIIRHSDAKHVDISFDQEGDKISLTIHDHGTVTGPGSLAGQGIGNMKMRAVKINGKLSIGTDHGYNVVLELVLR